MIGLVLWLLRRQPKPAPKQLPRALAVGDAVFVTQGLDLEAMIGAISGDRRMVTVVDDWGQPHWIDAHNVYPWPGTVTPAADAERKHPGP